MQRLRGSHGTIEIFLQSAFIFIEFLLEEAQLTAVLTRCAIQATVCLASLFSHERLDLAHVLSNLAHQD